MPATLTDYTQQAQEQTLKVIRDSQEGMVEAVRAWASVIEKVAPAVPELPALPLADEFPSPKEIVETSFGFAEQLLEAQRQFLGNVLTAAAPVLDASTSTEQKKPAAKSA
jgi:hypothetical protein